LDIDLHIAIEALESHMTDVRESRRLLADWKSLARAYEMNYR
jgi:hypothetical protein